jgi:3-hydroxyacyl-[acyl-carrier-protein] dehydratase
MRWFWIDRFTEFVSGREATAVKCVSLAEDHLHDHFPGNPVLPNSLVLEGLAQTGGLLVAEHNEFTKRVILAKVSRVTFHFSAEAGEVLVYRVKIEDVKDDGAVVTCQSHVGDRLQAEAEIFFAHVDDRTIGTALFEPPTFINWLRMLKLYEVGRRQDGSPLKPPKEFEYAAESTSGFMG